MNQRRLQADPPPTVLEAQLEAYFRSRVRLALGGLVIKMAPTVRGVPDRLVILPGGRVYFVELKTDKGRLSEIQKHRHELIRALGARVYVLYGRVEINDWIRDVAKDFDPKTRKPRRRRCPSCKTLDRAVLNGCADPFHSSELRAL